MHTHTHTHPHAQASDSSEDDEKALRLKRKQAATTSVVPKEEGGLWDGLSGSDDSEEQED